MVAEQLSFCNCGSHEAPAAQVRGSIPLYWGQDVASMSPMNPKPAIQLQQNDPHFLATRLHFQARACACRAPRLKQALGAARGLLRALLYLMLH